MAIHKLGNHIEILFCFLCFYFYFFFCKLCKVSSDIGHVTLKLSSVVIHEEFKSKTSSMETCNCPLELVNPSVMLNLESLI